MNNIITITDKGGIQTVNARELHLFLEVGKDYSTWIKDRIEKYSFEEGKDFSPVLGKSIGGRPSTEYHISIDMAKELAMVERNEKGKQARQYFIEVEKAYRAQKPKELTFEEQVVNVLGTAQAKIHALEAKVQDMRPDANFGKSLKDSSSNYTATQVAKEVGIRSAIALNQFLKEKEVIFHQSGAWKPYSKYSELGYFTYTSVIIPKGDATYTKECLKFTAEGRAFVHDLVKKERNKVNHGSLDNLEEGAA